jgi:hypothetical protein
VSPTRINLSVAVLASAGPLLALAGCGGGSPSNGRVAHLATNAGSRTTISGGATGPGSGSPEAEALAFAKCMRSGGLPNFPDPKAGGGFEFQRGAGVDPSSPAFKAAQAKCKKFQPEGPGSGPPPSAQTLAHYLKVAQCMRSHGVPEFPDPRTSVPSNLHPPAGASRFVISDIEGVILVMGSIDTQSPTFTRAAAACAFPLHNH